MGVLGGFWTFLILLCLAPELGFPGTPAHSHAPTLTGPRCLVRAGNQHRGPLGSTLQACVCQRPHIPHQLRLSQQRPGNVPVSRRPAHQPLEPRTDGAEFQHRRHQALKHGGPH